jgi:hypothetical protein
MRTMLNALLNVFNPKVDVGSIPLPTPSFFLLQVRVAAEVEF